MPAINIIALDTRSPPTRVSSLAPSGVTRPLSRPGRAVYRTRSLSTRGARWAVRGASLPGLLASLDPWALALSAAAVVASFHVNVGMLKTLAGMRDSQRGSVPLGRSAVSWRSQ